MGADFIEKAAPSFQKSWDRGRVSLATSTLFTAEPSRLVRTVAADVVGEVRLQPGDVLVVQVEGGGLTARRGNAVVARAEGCRPGLIAAVEASCGLAKGTVEHVHNLAGAVEISLC